MKNRHIAAAAAALALFAALILLVCLADVAPIGPEGTRVGLSGLNGWFHGLTGFQPALYRVTQITGACSLLTAAALALVWVWQFIRARGFGGMDRGLLMIAALYAVTLALYAFFEKCVVNYRPVLMPGADAPEASFPSSHTMLAIVVMGSAAMLAGRIENRGARAAVRGLCLALMAVTVIGRLLCGVHWLTDVLGGILVGTALLSAYAAAGE